jgi:hypothetical protein
MNTQTDGALLTAADLYSGSAIYDSVLDRKYDAQYHQVTKCLR